MPASETHDFWFGVKDVGGLQSAEHFRSMGSGNMIAHWGCRFIAEVIVAKVADESGSMAVPIQVCRE